jgi:hypothetical protein
MTFVPCSYILCDDSNGTECNDFPIQFKLPALG